MIELGMLIDVSHCTPIARRQIYDIADASGKPVPLLATHVGAYVMDPSPYNLTDEEIRRIARDGGVIGVVFMPYWLMPKESGQGTNFIYRHIQYLVHSGGKDAVGIGTDFDGFTTPPDDLDNASPDPATCCGGSLRGSHQKDTGRKRFARDPPRVEEIRPYWPAYSFQHLS